MKNGERKPGKTLLILAFAAIYLIWGSVYLALRFAVETLPPYLMQFTRYFTAGVLLYAMVRLRGEPRPATRHWATAAAVGGLMLLGGAGTVAWSVQWIPSGLAALIVALVPVWMVLLDWVGPAKRRPTPIVVTGLVLGLIGVAVLVGPVDLSGGGRMQFLGALALVFASLSWATGSVYGLRLPHPTSPWMTAAMQMTMGGLLLLAVGTLAGEWALVDPAGVSLMSLLSLAYLIAFGAMVGFAAYVFLLHHVTPAQAGSYAYVNPVVAVILGWTFAEEPVTGRTLLAAASILTGVVLIVTHRSAVEREDVGLRRERSFRVSAKQRTIICNCRGGCEKEDASPR